MRCCLLILFAMAVPGIAAAVEPQSSRDKTSSTAAGKELLQKKLAQLKVLQAEIQHLRNNLRADQQLLIRVQMLEATPKRFQEAGVELQNGSVTTTLLGPSNEGPVKAGAITHGGQAEDQLRRWQQQRLIRTIAEPQLITISGRPASFSVGGKLPQPVIGIAGKTSYRAYGTHVDLVALTHDDGTIRLELRASHSDLDYNRTVSVDGADVPGLIVREVDTAATLQPGETIVVGGFVSKQIMNPPSHGNEADESDEAENTELIVLATVEYVDAMRPVETDRAPD